MSGLLDFSDNADRRNNMKEIKREIALKKDDLARQQNHNQTKPTALGAASIHCLEVELELLETKLEALNREVEQSFLSFAPSKRVLNVSRPLPILEDPGAHWTFTLMSADEAHERRLCMPRGC